MGCTHSKTHKKREEKKSSYAPLTKREKLRLKEMPFVPLADESLDPTINPTIDAQNMSSLEVSATLPIFELSTPRLFKTKTTETRGVSSKQLSDRLFLSQSVICKSASNSKTRRP
jgi:hypothetical protein